MESRTGHAVAGIGRDVPAVIMKQQERRPGDPGAVHKGSLPNQ
jgi:hypothetical protein